MAGTRSWRLGFALIVLALGGCETFATVDQALYEIVPTHPVTGAPVPNLVSTEQEVQQATGQHGQLLAAAQREGIEVDEGTRLDAIQRVFMRLVAVAHRPDLPWQVHLLDVDTVNAFTIGGGYVYVFDGLFGDRGLVRDGDDEELAAVLAHEIAHVTMLHVSLTQTWQLLVERSREDPFYAASFTTEQEAEADKLSVLYMALAGFDPRAGARIWGRAHQRQGSDPAQTGFLYDHPLNADRVGIVQEAAAQVMQYYTPGQENPDWALHLADNPLFPRIEGSQEYQEGAGVLQAVGAAADAIVKHEQAKDEAEAREAGYALSPQGQGQLVRLLATQAGRDAYGRPAIHMQFQNGSRHNVAALGVTILYVSGQQVVAQDPNCGGPASIPAGQTVWLSCPMHAVQGAGEYRVQVTGVEFR